MTGACKIAVCLSGSVREPWHKSLESIGKLKANESEVDVYIHTWKNVESTQLHSWSKAVSLEPESHIINSYQPKKVEIEDWETVRPLFVENHLRWQRDYGLKSFTNYGAQSFLYSLQRSFSLIAPDDFPTYDLIVRLRFDCLLVSDPWMGGLFDCFGLHIPAGIDFGGLCDQLAFFKCDRENPGDDHKSYFFASSYFCCYERLDRMTKAGAEYHPEGWVKRSVDEAGTPVTRPHFAYTIH